MRFLGFLGDVLRMALADLAARPLRSVLSTSGFCQLSTVDGRRRLRPTRLSRHSTVRGGGSPRLYPARRAAILAPAESLQARGG